MRAIESMRNALSPIGRKLERGKAEEAFYQMSYRRYRCIRVPQGHKLGRKDICHAELQGGYIFLGWREREKERKREREKENRRRKECTCPSREIRSFSRAAMVIRASSLLRSACSIASKCINCKYEYGIEKIYVRVSRRSL